VTNAKPGERLSISYSPELVCAELVGAELRFCIVTTAPLIPTVLPAMSFPVTNPCTLASGIGVGVGVGIGVTVAGNGVAVAIGPVTVLLLGQPTANQLTAATVTTTSRPVIPEETMMNPPSLATLYPVRLA